MSEEKTAQEQNEYLQRVLETFKKDPNDSNLSQSERLLLQQALSKEAQINQLIEQMNNVKEELENKQKELQLLDQRVLFERGQMSGVVDALLALKDG